jgi:(p)ppGpp synthase/HD superfamily hydrolase
MITRDPTRDHEIEEAIVFLVTRMQESGHNPKPVILHSVRVGMHLFNDGYESDVVKAGLLHDIVEDSDTTVAEIEDRFGPRVARLVAANTFDHTQGDRFERGRDCIRRCLEVGRAALVVKAADMLDNSPYIDPRGDEAFCKSWFEEMKHLIDVSKPILMGEAISEQLARRYREVMKSWPVC